MSDQPSTHDWASHKKDFDFLEILVQPGDYLLLRLPPKLDLPPALTKLLIEPTASKYLNSITRTDRETSLVLTLPEEVSTSTVEHLQELQDVQIDSDWKCLRIRGPMQFDLVGVMAEVSKTLSKAQISLFATSTWDTDYILVKKLEEAIEALKKDDWAVSHYN